MNDTPADICIIGAGSSGIAVAKALHDKGIGFEICEKGSDIGGMWRYGNDNGMSCAYRSLHIDTSRDNLGYSDFPVSADKPDFLSHTDVLAYLEAYADRFDARRRIRFNCEVTALARDRLGWRVTTTQDGQQETRHYGAVIVANGHLWDPRWPSFPGAFGGDAIHASQYRTAQPFDDRKVLVVGLGNSAVDIAVDLCRRASHVALSTRTGAHIMPKYLMGIPTDRWSAFFSRRLNLPTTVTRRIMARLARLALGDQTRFGVPRPAHPLWREHTTLSQELLPYIGHGWISMRPDIEAFDDRDVVFTDGTREKFDAIIYATGYKASFPFLAPEIFAVPEDGGMVELYRRITPPNQPGLFFAGLVQPIGPTIPLVEVQARWIAAVLSGKVALPAVSDMALEVRSFHQHRQRTWLNSARYTLEVDFKDYVAELNGDIANAARGRSAALPQTGAVRATAR